VKARGFQFKRDSVLRMNLAQAVQPYRHDTVFTQSPLTAQGLWKNATSSALLHRETVVTAFQYPFAINLADCRLDDAAELVNETKAPDVGRYENRGEQYRDWLRHLLRAISELNGVSGNHARSYYEMAPASIVMRLTGSLVAGYETYGFKGDGSLPEIVDGIRQGDYPGDEFYLGGQVVKSVFDVKTIEALKTRGVKMFRMTNGALDAIAREVCGRGFLPQPTDAI
jgi:CRISPR-associated protein Cst2